MFAVRLVLSTRFCLTPRSFSRTVTLTAKLDENLGAFDKFNLSEKRRERLKNRGVESLFPVQYRSFNEIIQGKDCIVQAHTGTGKTLAFTLPLVERLETDWQKTKIIGRAPRCLVLEPTRELARQISDDFHSIKTRFLNISTLYGGKEYLSQETSLRKGSDIVVGTPGRIKDFLRQNKLNLRQCETIVLDEVDRMLDMGFQDDVDFIIKNASNGEKKSQMIVFSATIPSWLKQRVSFYMSKDNFSFVNLIGNSQQKTSVNVEHFALKINERRCRAEILLKLFEKFSQNLKESQTIVFCQTKAECDELMNSNQIHSSYSAAVLHGNLSQRKREDVLKNFRNGSTRFLITTDIAARGLDIPQVDLILLTSPPQDWESYVHRSGRTGRAGNKGKAICIYNQQQMKQMDLIQRNAKLRFRHVDVNSFEILQ